MTRQTITFDPVACFGSTPRRTWEQWVSAVAQQPGLLRRINVAARALARPTPAQVDILKVAADCFVLWCSHSRTHESLRARMAHMLGGRVDTLVDDANALAERIHGYDNSDHAVVIVSRLLTWLQGTWLLGELPTAAEQALVDPLLDGKRHALSVQLDMPRIEGLRMVYGDRSLIAGIGIDRIIVGSRIVYGEDPLDNGVVPLADFLDPDDPVGPGLGVEFDTGQRIQVVLRRAGLTNGDHRARLPIFRELQLSAFCE